MKLTNIAPAAAGLFLILCGCAQTPVPAPDTRDADIAALKAVETQWNADWAAKDVDKIAAHYAADAVLMTPGAAAVSTDDTRKAMIRGLLTDMAGSLSFQATFVEVAKSGDIGATRGTYNMTMVDPATKKPVADHGSYVTVYRKQDGAWKAFSDINASEVPPAAPPQTQAKPKKK